MKKNIFVIIINFGLLVTGIAMIFSGLLIQFAYHMGNNGNITVNKYVLQINYIGWSDIHKLLIVTFSLLMIYHIYQHWKWYKSVVVKKIIRKNKQTITLSLLFILVAITGYLPWLTDLLNGSDLLQKTIIEIHDKLALIFSIFLILHIIRKKIFFLIFL